jgi:hypothetical protein
MGFIFTEAHARLIMQGDKTQTRRVVRPHEYLVAWGPGPKHAPCVIHQNRLKWQVGRTYAVQTGRGKPAVCRIRLLNLRHEPLHVISLDDLRREGVRCDTLPAEPPDGLIDLTACREAYRLTWERINRRAGWRWHDNPQVWVVTFELAQEGRPA